MSAVEPTPTDPLDMLNLLVTTQISDPADRVRLHHAIMLTQWSHTGDKSLVGMMAEQPSGPIVLRRVGRLASWGVTDPDILIAGLLNQALKENLDRLAGFYSQETAQVPRTLTQELGERPLAIIDSLDGYVPQNGSEGTLQGMVQHLIDTQNVPMLLIYAAKIVDDAEQTVLMAPDEPQWAIDFNVNAYNQMIVGASESTKLWMVNDPAHEADYRKILEEIDSKNPDDNFTVGFRPAFELMSAESTPEVRRTFERAIDDLTAASEGLLGLKCNVGPSLQMGPTEPGIPSRT